MHGLGVAFGIAFGMPGFALACTGSGGGREPAPPPARAPGPPGAASAQVATARDSIGRDLVPPGYGTLRQDDIAVTIPLQGVIVKAIPLEESLIRLLSPDSYRALRDLLESRRDRIAELAARRALRDPSLWYVTYIGLEPNARFSPMEFRITSAARDYRPVEIIPLNTGFGEQRLDQRETQSAIYLFENGVDTRHPLVITVQTEQSAAWGDKLRRIERERASVRSRAAQSATPPA